jgi:hypothetical protein
MPASLVASPFCAELTMLADTCHVPLAEHVSCLEPFFPQEPKSAIADVCRPNVRDTTPWHQDKGRMKLNLSVAWGSPSTNSADMTAS